MTAPPPRASEAHAKPINLRLRTETRALIDSAASAQGKSRSEFMIDASHRAAEEALLDRTVFNVDPDTYDAFLARLDAPAKPNDKLRALLGATPPWSPA